MPDLEAMTVTIPVQTVTSPTGYSFTQCLYDSRMFAAAGETSPSFTDADAQDIVLKITADGDLSLYKEGADGAEGHTDMIAHWGWSANYGYLTGLLHKTASFEPDAAVEPLLGKHTCNVFNGLWCYLWSDDSADVDWHEFNIADGTGISEIVGVEEGDFDVNIISLGGLEVEFQGLWWGGLSVTATYDPATKTFTFPLQSVWGGYTFCNSSMCDLEVPTAADVVPATAVVNEDGSITMNYTVEYSLFPYLCVNQVLAGNGADTPTVVDITMDSFPGVWNSTECYSESYYVISDEGWAIVESLNDIEISVMGSDIIISNFFGGTLTGTVDLENRTITFPVQTVESTAGYSYTFCKYDKSLTSQEPYIAEIADNGDIIMPESFCWYDSYYNYNYGWGNCRLHRTEAYKINEEINPILGEYNVVSFTGEWTYIFAEGDDDDWHSFDASTGEGYDEIAVETCALPFSVSVLGVNENDVTISGVIWGDSGSNIRGTVDMEAKTITFPVQSVYVYYTLCNYSAWDEEEPVTEKDVVATIADNGDITLNYCFTYEGYNYLGAQMTLSRQATSGISSVIPTNDAPVEYFNLQGIRVINPAAGHIYIQRQGNSVKKVIK